MSELFPQKFWKLNNYFYPFYRFIIEKHFFRLLCKKPLILLDAGCGPHICSVSKVPENITAIGLDVSRKNIHLSHKKAKEKGYANFHFVVGSITYLSTLQNKHL